MKCAKIVTILQSQENISDANKGELSSHNVSLSHYLQCASRFSEQPELIGMICQNYNLSEMIQNQYSFYADCIFVVTGAKCRYT